jgi:hypothetical protein
MNDRTVYQHGTTVRFTCEFYDFDGLLKSPNIVKLKVYDNRYNLIFESLNVTQVSEGKYQFDYVPEEDNRVYYYEWYGELDGTPSLRRGSFITKFI